jgi:hypothetical protein
MKSSRKILKIAVFFWLIDVLFLMSSYLFMWLANITGYPNGVILQEMWWLAHDDIGHYIIPYIFPVITNHPPYPGDVAWFMFEILCSIKFFFIGIVLALFITLYNFMMKKTDPLSPDRAPDTHDLYEREK